MPQLSFVWIYIDRIVSCLDQLSCQREHLQFVFDLDSAKKDQNLGMLKFGGRGPSLIAANQITGARDIGRGN
jgi:hypothetical protein